MSLAWRWAAAAFGRARHAARTSGALASFARSYARTQPHYLRERWPGELDLGRATRVALFAHFDAAGTVHDFVHHYLHEIKRAGFTTIVVSNAPRLGPDAVARLSPLCALVLRRDNLGRDFGAFRDALTAIPELGRLDSMLLANDSVYGPFQDLGDLIGRMSPEEADVWGITDSWERHFHLQSYFLLFGRRALASDSFRRFWAGIRYVQSKAWVIDRYEIGLTRTLLKDGLRCRAAFPYREVATSLLEALHREVGAAVPSEPRRRFTNMVLEAVERGVPLNASHFFWEHLIVRMGCPFLKQELLRDNPARIPGVLHWQRAVQSVSKYDTDLIGRHLEGSVRNRAV